MTTATTTDEFEEPDEEERKTNARRLFTYSVPAIKAAAVVDRIFVNHPDFKACLEGCDRIFQLSRELTVPQGLVIAGPTGSGKTAFIKYYRRSLPKSNLFELGLGAIAVRLPSRPTVGHFVGSLLAQIRYPFPSVNAQTLSLKRQILIDVLRQKGTRLLFVDEAHHLRSQVRVRSRVEDGTVVSDCMRELMDEVPLGLVLTGSDGLMNLAEIDEHLNNRISGRFELRNFLFNAQWLGLLRSFARQSTAFDLSMLGDRAEAERLHAATSGSLREFKRLITEAVLVAHDAHCTAMSADHLAKADERVHGASPKPGNPYAK